MEGGMEGGDSRRIAVCPVDTIVTIIIRRVKGAVRITETAIESERRRTTRRKHTRQ